MQFHIMPRIYVRQFILGHIAKCQSTKSWLLSSYIPMRNITVLSQNRSKQFLAWGFFGGMTFGASGRSKEEKHPCVWYQQQYAHRQETIDTTVPLPDGEKHQ